MTSSIQSDYFKGPWQKLTRKPASIKSWCAAGHRLVFYDLGSTGGTPPPFCWIPEWIDAVNFEPDPRGINPADRDTLPLAIGPDNLDILYMNRRPTTSSLLPPCRRVIDRYDFTKIFKTEGNIFDTVTRKQVRTSGLDRIIKERNLSPPEFIKIDVQGLSLEVLESAKKCLTETTLGILIEVEFIETYRGQKTFGHVHEFLYERGFEIFRLSNLNRWYFKTDLQIQQATGQHVFCDLLYLKSIDSIGQESPFWSESMATKMIQLMLLFNLNDAAAAYWERFRRHHILSPPIDQKLRSLITGWNDALTFFYRNRFFTRDFLLDISPRKIFRFLKRFLHK